MADELDAMSGIKPVPSSSHDLIGWEPVTNPIKPTRKDDVRMMVGQYLNLKSARRVVVVRDESDGTLSIWEETPLAKFWKP
jgi:hypothetical protein